MHGFTPVRFRVKGNFNPGDSALRNCSPPGLSLGPKDPARSSRNADACPPQTLKPLPSRTEECTPKPWEDRLSAHTRQRSVAPVLAATRQSRGQQQRTCSATARVRREARSVAVLDDTAPSSVWQGQIWRRKMGAAQSGYARSGQVRAMPPGPGKREP